jgi:hypothetical protein
MVEPGGFAGKSHGYDGSYETLIVRVEPSELER